MHNSAGLRVATVQLVRAAQSERRTSILTTHPLTRLLVACYSDAPSLTTADIAVGLGLGDKDATGALLKPTHLSPNDGGLLAGLLLSLSAPACQVRAL